MLHLQEEISHLNSEHEDSISTLKRETRRALEEGEKRVAMMVAAADADARALETEQAVEEVPILCY